MEQEGVLHEVAESNVLTSLHPHLNLMQIQESPSNPSKSILTESVFKLYDL